MYCSARMSSFLWTELPGRRSLRAAASSGLARALCRSPAIRGRAQIRTDLGNDGVPFRNQLSQLRPKLPANNVSGALLRPAAAGMILPRGQIESIVERQFRSGGNSASCNNPYFAANYLRFAIRRTRMIDESRHVPLHAAVEVISLVQREEIDGAAPGLRGFFEMRQPAPVGFGLGDLLAGILNDAFTFGDVPDRKDTAIVNTGLVDDVRRAMRA